MFEINVKLDVDKFEKSIKKYISRDRDELVFFSYLPYEQIKEALNVLKKYKPEEVSGYISNISKGYNLNVDEFISLYEEFPDYINIEKYDFNKHPEFQKNMNEYLTKIMKFKNFNFSIFSKINCDKEELILEFINSNSQSILDFVDSYYNTGSYSVELKKTDIMLISRYYERIVIDYGMISSLDTYFKNTDDLKEKEEFIKMINNIFIYKTKTNKEVDVKYLYHYFAEQLHGSVSYLVDCLVFNLNRYFNFVFCDNEVYKDCYERYGIKTLLDISNKYRNSLYKVRFNKIKFTVEDVVFVITNYANYPNLISEDDKFVEMFIRKSGLKDKEHLLNYAKIIA